MLKKDKIKPRGKKIAKERQLRGKKKTEELYKDAQRRRGEIDKYAAEKNKKEMDNMKSKPAINKKSSRLMSKKQSSPIYQRYQDILEKKEQKRKELQQSVLEEKMENHPEDFFYNFTPSLNQSQITAGKSPRKFDEFLKELKVWNTVKQRKKYQRVREELKKQSEYTFRPKINDNSLKIIMGKELPSFLEKESSFLEKMNSTKREKIEKEVDSFMSPLTENCIKDLKSSKSSLGNK